MALTVSHRPYHKGLTLAAPHSSSVRPTFCRNSSDLCDVFFIAPPRFVPCGYSCPHGCCAPRQKQNTHLYHTEEYAIIRASY